jgi:hypothetical protein
MRFCIFFVVKTQHALCSAFCLCFFSHAHTSPQGIDSASRRDFDTVSFGLALITLGSRNFAIFYQE